MRNGFNGALFHQGTDESRWGKSKCASKFCAQLKPTCSNSACAAGTNHVFGSRAARDRARRGRPTPWIARRRKFRIAPNACVLDARTQSKARELPLFSFLAHCDAVTFGSVGSIGRERNTNNDRRALCFFADMPLGTIEALGDQNSQHSHRQLRN